MRATQSKWAANTCSWAYRRYQGFALGQQCLGTLGQLRYSGRGCKIAFKAGMHLFTVSAVHACEAGLSQA